MHSTQVFASTSSKVASDAYGYYQFAGLPRWCWKVEVRRSQKVRRDTSSGCTRDDWHFVIFLVEVQLLAERSFGTMSGTHTFGL